LRILGGAGKKQSNGKSTAKPLSIINEHIYFTLIQMQIYLF